MSSVVDGIHRLEAIGKKGKLSKIIKLTIEHFEYLKQSLNDFSLKILAYIIKGFFLAIKKSYENFNKDLEHFIDYQIKGINKIPNKKEAKDEKKQNHGDIFTIQNFSLYSENIEFQRFLEDTNMSIKLNSTLKRINKKFSSLDFNSLSEHEKREYLNKNLVQPLSNTLPLHSEFFQNSNSEQCMKINECFADFIGYDWNLLNSQKYTQSKKFTQQNKNQIDTQINFEDVVLTNSIKNFQMKYDRMIEYDFTKLWNSKKNMHFNDLYNIKIFQKNFRIILLDENLAKFKQNLLINEREKYLFFNSRENLITCNYEDFDYTKFYENEIRNENFRESLLKNNLDYSISDRVISTPSAFNNDVNFTAEKNIDVNFGDNITQINDNGQNSNNKSKNIETEEERQLLDLLDSKIKYSLENIFQSRVFFKEFNLQMLANYMKKDKYYVSNISIKSECSLLLYNMLILSQEKNYQLFQNELFGKIKL